MLGPMRGHRVGLNVVIDADTRIDDGPGGRPAPMKSGAPVGGHPAASSDVGKPALDAPLATAARSIAGATPMVPARPVHGFAPGQCGRRYRIPLNQSPIKRGQKVQGDRACGGPGDSPTMGRQEVPPPERWSGSGRFPSQLALGVLRPRDKHRDDRAATDDFREPGGAARGRRVSHLGCPDESGRWLRRERHAAVRTEAGAGMVRCLATATVWSNDVHRR